MADALWRHGLQERLSEPVAFLLERDEEMEARLGELGFRFFTSIDAFRRHVQGLAGEADEEPPPFDTAGPDRRSNTTCCEPPRS